MLQSELREAIMRVRDGAAAAGTEVAFSLHRETSHLMRIGNNSVSLNTSEALTRLDVEVTEGRRQGSHTHLGELKSVETVQRAFDIAKEKAEVAMPKDYTPVRAVVEETVQEDQQYDPTLGELEPAVKAQVYRQIMEELGDDYNYSGSWSSGIAELYVVTSANTNESWHIGTDQKFTVVLKDPDRKWELTDEQTGWRSSDVSAERSITTLRELLPYYEANEGFKVEPGEHTVVFGPQAVAEIAMMAAVTGLTGLGWEEKQGWTSHFDIGDPVLGENLTIVDDPLNEQTFGVGFDYLGKRRRRFPLVEGGVLSQLMYDAIAAGKYGKEPTGHDTPSLSIVVETGDGPSSPLEAVSGMERVLWIPALHYTNIPDRSKGLFTGSSRFNAMLVENGQVVQPLFSTRITDAFQRVFGRVQQTSADRVSVNLSNTYGRRSPSAASVPSYMVVDGVKVTDSADSF